MQKLLISIVVSSLLSTGVISTDAETLQAEIEKSINSQISIELEEKENQIVEEVKEVEEVEEVIKEEVEVVENKDLRLINLGDKFTFRQGVSSEEVRELRYFLKEKGYSVDTNLSTYDTGLMGIIKQYQKSKGIGVDGFVGKESLRVINKDIQDNEIHIPKQKLVINEGIKTPTGTWVIINKSNNTLYHMKGREVLERFHVATGKNPGDTPEGKFSIVVKVVNPSWGGAGKYKPIKGGAYNNPLGKRWMGLSIGGGGTYGIHGNYDFKSLGKYASMGCIRMYNDEAESLYDKLPKGTVVWIGRTTKLQELGISVEWAN